MSDSDALINETLESRAANIQVPVDEYKQVDKEFHEMLYSVILKTCRSLPWVIEMTSLKYMNSREGTRNIFVVSR